MRRTRADIQVRRAHVPDGGTRRVVPQVRGHRSPRAVDHGRRGRDPDFTRTHDEGAEFPRLLLGTQIRNAGGFPGG